MTPYEKNLEVWRQLWRVVERADVVLMILDARNPLVFRCADFEAYVRGTRGAAGRPKEIIFLLNKSDLLTEGQRGAWAAYFTERGESFIFFSAAPAAKATAAATTTTTTTGEPDDDGGAGRRQHRRRGRGACGWREGHARGGQQRSQTAASPQREAAAPQKVAAGPGGSGEPVRAR
ncbi:GTP-binding protein [Trypanosoma conorhini]|uniref:GTP-binding protein n=1 Tax=Trypanosoma conorhini TaxID=83891 RepID=A0A422Q9T6_9TRYP|nr:GTP-binding protein [Trypanosoma conorhini]RNF26709.1 GTP-binding protein [Trypanosoma conorhini]